MLFKLIVYDFGKTESRADIASAFAENVV